MQLFVIILHIMLCTALILVILLQPGKEGAAAFGGGGGNSAYGARSNAHPLARATTVVAVLFMFTSITLALYSSESVRAGSDIEDDILRLQQEEEAAPPKFNPVSTKSEEPAPVEDVAPLEMGDDGAEGAATGQPAEGDTPAEGSVLPDAGGDVARDALPSVEGDGAKAP